MVDLVPAIDNVQDRMEKRTDVAYSSAMQTTIEKYFVQNKCWMQTD